MAPLLEDSENAAAADKEQHIKKKIIETSLYSVYLLSPCDPGRTSCQVLLIVHPPAEASTEHILPVKINATATKTEILKKVSKTVQAHFDETV